MEPLLLYVRSVAFIEAARLHNIAFALPDGVLLRYRRHFEELPIIGLAECRCASKTEDKSRIFTTSLSATLTAPFVPGNRPLAFLLTTVAGERFLMGWAEPPYPAVGTETAMPGRVADAAGYSLTAELTDTLGLMRVLD